MPIPRPVAYFNKVVTNRIIGPLAPVLPGFAVVIHRGRVSGREYRTPLNCWLDVDSAIIALTYGPGTDWLRNLEAAGHGDLVARGETYRVGAPAVIGYVGMKRMPLLVRPLLIMLGVGEFAVLPLLNPARPT
jgi:deazaflavin-dependent oxidoreductase (nitroreductase family)